MKNKHDKSSADQEDCSIIAQVTRNTGEHESISSVESVGLSIDTSVDSNSQEPGTSKEILTDFQKVPSDSEAFTPAEVNLTSTWESAEVINSSIDSESQFNDKGKGRKFFETV